MSKDTYLVIIQLERTEKDKISALDPRGRACGVGLVRYEKDPFPSSVLIPPEVNHAYSDPKYEIGGGRVLIDLDCLAGNPTIISHELGHAFGLYHDFSDDELIMSYGNNRTKISESTAHWLDVYPTFNESNSTSSDKTTIHIDYQSVEEKDENGIPQVQLFVAIEVKDDDGIHQVQLLVPTTKKRANGHELHKWWKPGDVKSFKFDVGMDVLPESLNQEEVWINTIDINGEATINKISLEKGKFDAAAPMLISLLPKETALLTNYPNPFNPETWIPYQLSKPADVTLTIYDIHGRVVRGLDLGHQRAGMYHSRSRAAHWNGRNAVGEPVASGLYFYTLKAGEFAATRKMLIRK